MKTPKNGDFYKELLNDNDFEAVLAAFCYMAMVSMVLMQFRRWLQIKKIIKNACRVFIVC